MAKYNILIKPSAVKEIENIPRKDRLRIIQKIQGLANNPRPQGCEKLTGENRYRIRQGVYRILYSVSDRELYIIVVKVGHRQDVYK
ncbi:MAG: type II toxin-antitoxin system RelE/ParE family toxin [Thermodesulfovibrionales bacterium]|nr:type II toxin-antitoxin system RelE/ParE family toxin [Thermodesulfovibrionales bacterium]